MYIHAKTQQNIKKKKFMQQRIKRCIYMTGCVDNEYSLSVLKISSTRHVPYRFSAQWISERSYSWEYFFVTTIKYNCTF